MPAIFQRESPRATVLVFDMSAKITIPDIEHMAMPVEQASNACGKIDVLPILRDVEGMDAGATLNREAIVAQARSVSMFESMAWSERRAG